MADRTALNAKINADIQGSQANPLTTARHRGVLLQMSADTFNKDSDTTAQITEDSTKRFVSADSVLDVLVAALQINGAAGSRTGDVLNFTIQTGGASFDVTANYNPTGNWNFQTGKLKINNVNVATISDIQTLQTAINSLSIPSNTDGLREGNTNLYFTAARARAAAPPETAQTIAALADNDESNVDVSVRNGLLVFNYEGTGPTPARIPSITQFSIEGLDPNNPPAAGSEIGGSRSITYNVNDADQVSGNLEVSLQVGSGQDTIIDNTIAPNANSQSVNFPGRNAAAGTTYTYTLSGEDMAGNEFERSFSVTIAQAHENAYFGVISTDDGSEPRWASFTPLPTGEQVVDVQSETYDFNTRTSTNAHGIPTPVGAYFYIMVPSDREPTSIFDIAEAIRNFTHRENARTISGQSYSVYFVHNQSTRASDADYRVRRTST